jgi:hypothetical protein
MVSGLSVSFAEDLDFADFTLVAIRTKINKSPAEKALPVNGPGKKMVEN